MAALFLLLHFRILDYAMCPEVLWVLMPPLARGSDVQRLWALALEIGHCRFTYTSATYWVGNIRTVTQYAYGSPFSSVKWT